MKKKWLTMLMLSLVLVGCGGGQQTRVDHHNEGRYMGVYPYLSSDDLVYVNYVLEKANLNPKKVSVKDWEVDVQVPINISLSGKKRILPSAIDPGDPGGPIYATHSHSDGTVLGVVYCINDSNPLGQARKVHFIEYITNVGNPDGFFDHLGHNPRPGSYSSDGYTLFCQNPA